MKVLEIYPKDFYVTMEFSLKEVRRLLTALNNAELKYDGKDFEERESVEFVKKQLYPLLERLYEENKQYDT